MEEGLNGIQEDWNSSMDGSNAILLPQKKKKKKNEKSKEKGKGSKRKKNKLAPPPSISKTKLKKLKKLQEEKEKKLLQIKSIEMLEKHKISDSAHSLLQSSGTIGQMETFQDKRRRVVQLAKAGLEVPEDILPLKMKKKRKRDNSSENEVSLNLLASDYAQTGGSDSDLDVVTQMEVDDCKQRQSTRIIVSEKCKSSEEVNVEPKEVIPSSKLVDTAINTSIDSDQNIAPSASCIYVERNNKKFEDQPESNLNVKVMKISLNNTIKACVNVPTVVVPVSRPKEVEKTRTGLPIIMMEQEIMEAINENPIILLCGETGCGKTTQVPQFLYEAGYGSSICSERKGIIGVTQPRRVAVLSTAKRVSFELGLRLGKEVGFQVRYDKTIGDNCSIKFMTDGILLREVQNDILLRRYSVIILDEAHERSLNTDILVGMLARVIKLRQDLYLEQQKKISLGVSIDPQNIITKLKLILMSATLRVEDFRKLFRETPPIIEVPGRQFHVAIHFSKKTQEDYLGQAYKKVLSIHKRLPPGGILVFVTGQREVELLCKQLRKASNEFIADKATRETDNETNPNIDRDMKDITEAFETADSSLDQQTDRFSSFDEDDDDFPEMDFDTHESESESDFEDDNEEESNFEHADEEIERADLAVDLSSLSASFEALAGKTCSTKSEDGPNLHLQTETAPPGPLHVLPLYAMLPASSQLRVFENVPEGERLVVVATNVAETSLTIPGIKYVVDTGKEKVKHYNFATGMGTFEVQWISKASAAQRAGRAGRTGRGHCYRLYSSAAFSKDELFLEFSKPEISQIPVEGVVLLIKSMGFNEVANFPFPTPPETKALREAENCLKSLEALDDQGITPMGRTMAHYPMSPHHSRMLLTLIQIMRNQHNYPRANLVLTYAIATVSALSFPNPFNMQFDGNQEHEESKEKLKEAKARVRETRAKFNNPSSDALSIAYALQLFELAENQFSFCQNHSLHLKTMEEMSKLRKQLLQLVFHQSKFSDEFGWNHGSVEEIELSWRVSSPKYPLLMNEEELLGQAICAGWADRVAKRVRKFSESSDNDQKARAICYHSCALNETIYLHRWSSVSRSAPEFLVYSELLQTNRPYMHGATSVKPEWLVKYASKLCSFSPPLSDPKPYYDPLNDQVMCWVSPSFGRHNWQLPLHSLPIKNDTLLIQSKKKKNDTLRVSVFANALLEGNVLPCLKTVQKFLAMSPSSVLRPEGMGLRRVGELLNGLKMESKIIDSRAMLREAWRENSRSLYSEIKSWFQEKFHAYFGELWEQMHSEVVLDGHELFARKEQARKRTKGK